jgi:tetratricopeptide (TPR) repeat protein
MLGDLLGTYGRSEEALSIIAEAQRQDPLDKPLQLALAGELFNLDRFQEAEKVVQGLLERDASDSVSNGYMGWILFEQDRLPEALEFFDRESIPFIRLTGFAITYQQLGEQDKALAAQQQLLEKYGDLAAYQQAQIYAMRGDPESAASWLQRAYEARDPGMTSIKTDSAFKDMQDDPVYKSVLAKMNIPD